MSKFNENRVIFWHFFHTLAPQRQKFRSRKQTICSNPQYDCPDSLVVQLVRLNASATVCLLFSKIDSIFLPSCSSYYQYGYSFNMHKTDDDDDDNDDKEVHEGRMVSDLPHKIIFQSISYYKTDKSWATGLCKAEATNASSNLIRKAVTDKTPYSINTNVCGVIPDVLPNADHCNHQNADDGNADSGRFCRTCSDTYSAWKHHNHQCGQ